MKIRATSNNSKRQFDVPDICPICDVGIKPLEVDVYYSNDKEEYTFLFQCPYCYDHFITIYKEPPYTYSLHTYYKIFPKSVAPKKFPAEINNLSPIFVLVYNQALEAENRNLDQIAGLGYRKSLEFLIKDFCIHKNPEHDKKIKKLFLGDVISNYIEDERILNPAKISAWLGNDHAHYVAKWENKDINDLKKFIETAVYFIAANISADEAEELVESSSE